MPKRVPAYRLHKPSGRAVVTLNGRDHYLGKHGSASSKSAYNKLIREWEATSRSTSFGISAGVTVAMVAADYLDHCEEYYPDATNSEAVQSRYAIKYLAPYFSEEAAAFGPLKLKAIRQELLKVKSSRTGEPFSRQYINKIVARICRMFGWAAENELVPIGTYQALVKVPGLKRGRCSAPEAPKVLPVDDSIVDATIPHLTPVLRDMVRLQQLTGMRPGEVCCLTSEMLDRSQPVWVGNLPDHKTAWRGRDRKIYFGPKAQEILIPYLNRPQQSPLFSPTESEHWRHSQRTAKRKTPLNCGNRRGYSRLTRQRKVALRNISEEYSTQSYGRAIRYACAKAFPIPAGSTKEQAKAHRAAVWWSPNQLRHATATRIRKAHGLEAAQVVLGHSKADVTQIYAEADEEKAIEIAKKHS